VGHKKFQPLYSNSGTTKLCNWFFATSHGLIRLNLQSTAAVRQHTRKLCGH